VIGGRHQLTYQLDNLSVNLGSNPGPVKDNLPLVRDRVEACSPQGRVARYRPRMPTNGAFETGEPHTGGEIAASIRRLHEESERFLAAISPAAFVAPQGEKWSPADHVRHLAKSTYPLARALGIPRLGIRVLFGGHAGASRSLPVLREDYLERLKAGGTAGRFAPAPRPLPDDPEAYRLRLLASWRTAAASVRRKMQRWPEPALDRHRLPHPLLGRISVREMLLFTLYHNAHHLNLVASRSRTSASRGRSEQMVGTAGFEPATP
jgi:hypothetical protein